MKGEMSKTMKIGGGRGKDCDGGSRNAYKDGGKASSLKAQYKMDSWRKTGKSPMKKDC